VSLAVFAWRLTADARQQAAARIARHDVGIHRFGGEVTVVASALLHAVPSRAVDAVGLPTHVVAHAGCRHQIAFVGGVDEHLPAVLLAAKHGDGLDAPLRFFDAFLAVQPFIAMNFHAGFAHE